MGPVHASGVLAAVLFLAPCASPADIVVGSDQRRTYDCRGGSATVEGGFNEISFRGCVAIVVNGGENTIDAGLAERIDVVGGDNRITWTERADGTRPRITNAGTDNVITSRPAPAGASASAAPAPPRSASPRPASPRPASPGQITITNDGVKVQGAGGSVVVGGPGGGTVTIKQEPPGGAGRIRVDGDDGKADHDCGGGSAAVNGDRNHVTLRNCDQVTVNGSANIVSVRKVAALTINGGDNKITWERAPDGSRPRIADNGTGNTVTGKR